MMLEARGYRHVTSNWHCRAGEIDLVMLDGEGLVLVEVKTRRGELAGRAEEAITGAKARKLLAAGEWFLADHPEHQHRIWRVDLVAITLHPASGNLSSSHYVNAIVEG
jgi:putative endonuclease